MKSYVIFFLWIILIFYKDRPWKYDKNNLHDNRLSQRTNWVDRKKKFFLHLVEKSDERHYTIVRVCFVGVLEFFRITKSGVN